MIIPMTIRRSRLKARTVSMRMLLEKANAHYIFCTKNPWREEGIRELMALGGGTGNVWYDGRHFWIFRKYLRRNYTGPQSLPVLKLKLFEGEG